MCRRLFCTTKPLLPPGHKSHPLWCCSLAQSLLYLTTGHRLHHRRPYIRDTALLLRAERCGPLPLSLPMGHHVLLLVCCMSSACVSCWQFVCHVCTCVCNSWLFSKAAADQRLANMAVRTPRGVCLYVAAGPVGYQSKHLMLLTSSRATGPGHATDKCKGLHVSQPFTRPLQR